jgi:hypothetical protein
MTGTFKPLYVIWRRERSIWTPDVEECVVDCVEENLDVSMR